MTWLDIGNGWRNLYLLSCAVQALALGSLFASRGWFVRRSRLACFLLGVTATPFVQYLWTLLLSFAWPTASKWVYIGALPALSAVCLTVMLIRRLSRLKALIGRGWAFAKRVCHFDKPALISLCFALCLGILLLPACVRYCGSMSTVSGGDTGEYMGLALRYCEDRDVNKLLEKEETVGHFRGHNHFPSLELFMSYALFHTGGDAYGYPYDKPVFAGLGLLSFYMAAAYLALLLILCRERKRWVLLGALLLNLVPQLVHSVAGAPRDIWRILALFWAMGFFAGFKPDGDAKRYIGKLLVCFAVCFTVMSAHVVCFVVLPFIVAAWVVWRWSQSLARGDRSAGRTLIRSVGLALGGAAGTVVAFLGNLWCYRRWGDMSPWRLMTTYTNAPWFSIYNDIEYRQDLTSTHIDFWSAQNDVLMGYATPIGVWGWWVAVLSILVLAAWLVARRIRQHRMQRDLRQSLPADDPSAVLIASGDSGAARIASALCFAALLTLITLAPMTGLLDTGLYSFSGTFMKLQRYTLQWFMLSAVMICTALSALDDLWPTICAWAKASAGRLYGRLSAHGAAVALVRRAPAYLCAVLCALSFVSGTSQTGYSMSFYRYSRDVMEDESCLLDNGFRQQYGLLMTLAEAVGDDQRILVTRPGYQYALRAKAYIINSNPIVPILITPLEEMAAKLKELNVALIASEPDFWDERYYAPSTLGQYLLTLPKAQVVETENMRLYLIDPSLVSALPKD